MAVKTGRDSNTSPTKDLKLTLIKVDKEGHSTLIKGKYTKRKQKLSTYMHPT
jgi:hypothetical protein